MRRRCKKKIQVVSFYLMLTKGRWSYDITVFFSAPPPPLFFFSCVRKVQTWRVQSAGMLKRRPRFSLQTLQVAPYVKLQVVRVYIDTLQFAPTVKLKRWELLLETSEIVGTSNFSTFHEPLCCRLSPDSTTLQSFYDPLDFHSKRYNLHPVLSCKFCKYASKRYNLHPVFVGFLLILGGHTPPKP